MSEVLSTDHDINSPLHSENGASNTGPDDDFDVYNSISSAARRVTQPEDAKEDQSPKARLRITDRGRVVLGVGVTGAVVGAAVGVAAGVNALANSDILEDLGKTGPEPTGVINVHVQNGDGLQKIIEEYVPEVNSGNMDWRDVAYTIEHLPENSELFTPGHILTPGETVAIPVYESK